MVVYTREQTHVMIRFGIHFVEPKDFLTAGFERNREARMILRLSV